MKVTDVSDVKCKCKRIKIHHCVIPRLSQGEWVCKRSNTLGVALFQETHQLQGEPVTRLHSTQPSSLLLSPPFLFLVRSRSFSFFLSIPSFLLFVHMNFFSLRLFFSLHFDKFAFGSVPLPSPSLLYVTLYPCLSFLPPCGRTALQYVFLSFSFVPSFLFPSLPIKFFRSFSSFFDFWSYVFSLSLSFNVFPLSCSFFLPFSRSCFCLPCLNHPPPPHPPHHPQECCSNPYRKITARFSFLFFSMKMFW